MSLADRTISLLKPMLNMIINRVKLFISQRCDSVSGWILIGTVVAVFISMFASIGCDGPLGPAGRDVEGLDIIPPVIFLTQPRPYSTVWDSFQVDVSTVDNVAIRKVSIAVDGHNGVGNQSFVSTAPPYTFMVKELSRGFHFISARSLDVAGNIADSPVVPIWFGYSEELEDTTVNLSYHSGDVDSIWAIPNESRTRSWWVRFETARECTLKTVNLMIGGLFADTSLAEVNVSILKGTNLPQEGIKDSTESVSGVDIGGELGMVEIDFSQLGVGGVPLKGRDNFFVVVSLMNPMVGDTLWLGSDDGDPAWNRSGIRDDLGWYYLDNKYGTGVQNNFLIDCNLYYGIIPVVEE